MSDHNGLRDLPSLTQTSLRKAVAATVAAHRNGWSDQDMGDEWGVSAGTVNNAQNAAHDLALMNWLKLGKRFGPGGLNTVLALLGVRAIQDTDVVLDVSKVPHDVASLLPVLIELLSDGDCKAADIRKLEEIDAIDRIQKVADFLRQRRDEVRLSVAVGTPCR